MLSIQINRNASDATAPIEAEQPDSKIPWPLLAGLGLASTGASYLVAVNPALRTVLKKTIQSALPSSAKVRQTATANSRRVALLRGRYLDLIDSLKPSIEESFKLSTLGVDYEGAKDILRGNKDAIRRLRNRGTLRSTMEFIKSLPYVQETRALSTLTPPYRQSEAFAAGFTQFKLDDLYRKIKQQADMAADTQTATRLNQLLYKMENYDPSFYPSVPEELQQRRSFLVSRYYPSIADTEPSQAGAELVELVGENDLRTWRRYNEARRNNLFGTRRRVY